MKAGDNPVRSRIRCLLWCALVLSLIANVLLVRFARRMYADKLAGQVWPLGFPFAAQSAPETMGQPTLLLLGDSRVADWGLPKLDGFHVVNYGARGITSAQLAAHARMILAETKPAVVVIQVGVNDLKLLGVRPELRDTLMDVTASNIVALAGESRRSGARVIVTPVWPAGDVSLARRFVWSSAVSTGIAGTNERLGRWLAGMDGVQVLDVFAVARGKSVPGKSPDWHRDTLHLHPEVYPRLTAALQEALATPRTNAVAPGGR